MASGILAGGMVEIAAAEVPTWRLLDLTAYVRVHQLVDHHIDRFMPKSAAVAGITGVLLLVLRAPPWERFFLLAGVVMTALVAVLSEVFNRPLNRLIAGWAPAAPPPEAAAVRALWARRHLLRTLPGVVALVCFGCATALRS